MAELLALNEAGELGVRAFTFDGDTPGDARKAVRTRGDIVVTNPDMLHQGILPHHTKWAQFFESLRYVVIDEMHSYRGVFGSHVANVLRRLQRICRFYGTEPLFILCSATIANPAELAGELIDAEVHAITESGAPQGAKQLLLWNPPVVNPDLGIRASARSQTTRIAKHGGEARPEEHRVRAVAAHGRGADQVPEGRLRPGPAQPGAGGGLSRRLPADASAAPWRSSCAPAASTAWCRPRRWNWAWTSARWTCAC